MKKCSNHHNIIPKHLTIDAEPFICLECTLKGLEPERRQLNFLEDQVREKLVEFYGAKLEETHLANRLIEQQFRLLGIDFQKQLNFFAKLREEIDRVENTLRTKFDSMKRRFEELARELQGILKVNFLAANENFELLNDHSLSVNFIIDKVKPILRVDSYRVSQINELLLEIPFDTLLTPMQELMAEFQFENKPLSKPEALKVAEKKPKACCSAKNAMSGFYQHSKLLGSAAENEMQRKYDFSPHKPKEAAVLPKTRTSRSPEKVSAKAKEQQLQQPPPFRRSKDLSPLDYRAPKLAYGLYKSRPQSPDEDPALGASEVKKRWS